MNSQLIFLLDKIKSKKRTQYGEVLMASNKSGIDVIVSSCWQEYQMANSLMLRLMEAASQVQIYAVVLLGGLVPLFQYIENISDAGGDPPYVLYLFAALIFAALGGYQIHLDNQVAEIDNYILVFLTPKLRKIISFLSEREGLTELSEQISDQILGYHLYWRTIRYSKVLGIWLSLGVIGRTGLAALSTTCLLIAYIYFERFFSRGFSSANPLETFLVIFILLCIVWTLISAIIVRFKYSNATNNYLENYPHKINYNDGLKLKKEYKINKSKSKSSSKKK